MLDDMITPYLRERRALVLAGNTSRLLGVILAVVLLYNIVLLIGFAEVQPALDVGLRISLGLCLTTAIGGTLIGLFLACIPWLPMPYMYRLPVSVLTGTLLIQVLLALLQSIPMLKVVYALIEAWAVSA